MKKYLKIAGLGLATTLALTVASSAQAYDFNFSFSDSNGTVTGTVFGLSEGLSSATSVLASSPEFGWVNEEFVNASSIGGVNEFTIFGGEITDHHFNTIVDDKQINFGPFNDFYAYDISTDRLIYEQIIPFGDAYSSATTPTSVPFGVSTNLSLLILGGLYGASRLRKTIVASKQIRNLET